MMPCWNAEAVSCHPPQGPPGAAGAEGRQGEKGAKVRKSIHPRRGGGTAISASPSPSPSLHPPCRIKSTEVIEFPSQIRWKFMDAAYLSKTKIHLFLALFRGERSRRYLCLALRYRRVFLCESELSETCLNSKSRHMFCRFVGRQNKLPSAGACSRFYPRLPVKNVFFKPILFYFFTCTNKFFQ